MAVIILRRAAITFAVLIAALLFVLVLQFPGSNEFILTAGALRINGFEKSDEGGAKAPEAPLYVSANGITFFIDRKSPLVAVLESGEEVALEMRSFLIEENAFTVRFDRNVSLSFLSAEAVGAAKSEASAESNVEAEADAEVEVEVDIESEAEGEIEAEAEVEVEAAIKAEIPKDVSCLLLAFALGRNATLESSNGELAISCEGGLYMLEGAAMQSAAHGGASRIEITSAAPSVLYVKAVREEPPTIEIVSEVEPPSVSYMEDETIADEIIEPIEDETIEYGTIEDVSLERIAQDASASEAAYLRVAESFAERILQAYQSAAASNAVTEELAAAFLAESARQGNLTAARSSLSSSFLNSDERSYVTSPFVGGLDAAWRKWTADNEREMRAYTSRLAARSPALFEKNGLVAFLISNRLADDYRRLANIAEERARQGSLTPRQAAGIIEFSLDRRVMPRSVPAVSSDTIALCEETLLKSLRYFSRIPSGSSSLYIEENAGTAGTISALEIAAILYRWGTANNEKSGWAAAARLITATVLRLAESESALPASIAIPSREGQMAAGAKRATIPIAAAYPLVEPLAIWYPRSVAVYPRYSIWTSAQNANIYFPRAGMLDFEADFPAGQSHFVVIRGVHDFYGIQWRGTTYNSDANFETQNAPSCRYISGEDTLFIKMQHGEERETVRIFYNNPN